MILLNFSHPLTDAHLHTIVEQTGREVERVIEVKAQFDPDRSFVEQARDLTALAGLTAQEWQALPLMVNLPSLNVIAALLLAELHGRCGYFPAVLRLRPVPNSTPPQFEVAEILNLQTVRDSARQMRG